MRFKVGICGNGTLDSNMMTPIGQDIIYKLCQKPISIQEIPLDIFESFQKSGVIRIENSTCYLNFTCFLKEDIELLNSRSEQLGRELGYRIMKNIGKDSKLNLTHYEVDVHKYLYFIIGCVCLDWHGLKILENLGLTLQSEEKNKVGCGNYTIFANENFPQELRGLFWGSHNSSYDKYCFTSFGDHCNYRKTIPDLVWGISNGITDDVVNDLIEDMIEKYMILMAGTLINKNFRESKVVTILEELKFIKNSNLNIPIIMYSDKQNVNRLIKSVDLVIYEWLSEYSSELKDIFHELTPVKFGVDFREVLIQVWHYIFGHANKYMSEEGFIFNPYSNNSDFNGFLPVIYESRCNFKL